MSKRKPIIGVFGQIEFPKNYIQPGYRRLSFNEDYPRVIHEAGGTPIVITPFEDHSGLKDLVAICDGLFFIGGDDLHPHLYGEEPINQLHLIDANRDAFEYEGLKLAEEMGLPCFGVCRGMQLMNVYFGGKLYQDIYSQANISNQHNQESHIGLGSHTVIVETGSFLDKAMGQKEIVTNTHHHQAVKDLAPGFKISGKSKDGVIEAIERVEGAFMAGVQWHPEMMVNYRNPEQLEIFKYFVSQCK